jgi:long-subunit fatty acid transport protein
MVDTYKETQSQVYQNINVNGDNINVYALNLDTDDKTLLLGPSMGKKINHKMSWGFSLFYLQRNFRKNQNQLSDLSSDPSNPSAASQEVSTRTSTLLENGVRPVLGFMWSPADKWSIGVKAAYNYLFASKFDEFQSRKPLGDTVTSFLRSSDLAIRKTPLEFSLGAAYFRNPYQVFSWDVDYFSSAQSQNQDVINFSAGFEHFFNETHAFRSGIYTNFSNAPTPSDATSAPLEKIDLLGLTLGYAHHHKGNVITFGIDYSQGSGKVQVFEGDKATRNLTQKRLGLILAASTSF